MKAFAEYIASAMYFTEAFLNADKHFLASSARSECPLYKKTIDKYPARVYSTKYENTYEGYMIKMQIPLSQYKKEKRKSGKRSSLWRKNGKTEM